MTQEYDLLVIGGGSAGVRTARLSASYGAKVALIENSKLGGTCVNLGCIPKKLFVYAADFAKAIKQSKYYGFEIDSYQFNWNTLLENKNKEINRLNGIYQNLLNNHKVEIFYGQAQFIDEYQVKVNNQILKTKKIVITTGNKPLLPKIQGIENAILSDDVFHLSQKPKSITVVGAGYIALELACFFNSIGTQTYILHRSDKLLRKFDQDIAQKFKDELESKSGIHFLLNKSIKKLEKTQSAEITITTEDNQEYTSEQVLYAIGRTPNYDGLAIEKSKVTLNSKNQIITNNQFQTSIDHIYALGDIIEQSIELTPVALEQGNFLASHLFGDNSYCYDASHIPTAVFTRPEIATVGLTENEVKEQEIDYTVYQSQFNALKQTLLPQELKESTYIKMIVNNDTNKVLGVHIMGSESAEMMQSIAVAIKAGATKEDFDKTIGIHPTIAEELTTLRVPRD